MASSDVVDVSTHERVPRNARIEKQLRDVVASIFHSKNFDNLTLKKVRATTEQALNLPDEFFKSDGKWNSRSKTIIKDEVTNQEGLSSSLEQKRATPKAEAPPRSKTVPAAPKHSPNTAPSDEDEPSTKQANKREFSEAASAPKKKRRTIDSSPAIEPGPELDQAVADEDEDNGKVETHKEEKMAGDSDLSSLEDDDPPPKKSRKKRSSSPHRSSPKPKPNKPDTKPKAENTTPSPNDVLIKTLQTQLAKCGVRKVWGAYLKSYDTPKQKMALLRSLLEEVGMTGRFSEEKARQIKDERELRADLEDVVVMEKKWGRKKEEPRKRSKALEGLEGLEGLIDEEESD